MILAFDYIDKIFRKSLFPHCPEDEVMGNEAKSVFKVQSCILKILFRSERVVNQFVQSCNVLRNTINRGNKTFLAITNYVAVMSSFLYGSRVAAKDDAV